jgi:hypothetical protein
MSMYKYTRQEAADILGISTRSVDRYIKAWKLRAKKKWKVVLVKSSDLENMNWWWSSNHEIITETNYSSETKKAKVESKWIDLQENFKTWLEEIYSDLRTEIKEKDILIRELSIRVWRSEEVAKNSVSLIDFKKSQFLLEESKSSLNQTVEDLEEDKKTLEWELKYQKTNNLILIVAIIVLFAVAGTIFVLKI